MLYINAEHTIWNSVILHGIRRPINNGWPIDVWLFASIAYDEGRPTPWQWAITSYFDCVDLHESVRTYSDNDRKDR